MNILADLRLRSGENQLTQKAFEGALPAVKSAVMDSQGRVWLFECFKAHLTPNHRSWVSDIETGFYYYGGGFDATDWQNSAIDRVKQSEVLDKFECIHCGEVYVRHQLRTTFCDNCDRILETRTVEANHE